MDATNKCPQEWISMCESYIRAGELSQLEALLEHPPSPACDLVQRFYYARLAVARADYKNASRMFQEVISTSPVAADSVLQQDSLIWLAYCHTLLGKYSLARTCIESMARVVAPHAPSYALIIFIRGLLIAETGTMAEAQGFFEHAYDLAWQHQDKWLEARCYANCAAVCVSQGLMSQAGRMIQQVEQLNQEGSPNRQQLIQIRNIEVYRLRLMGNLEQALNVALPIPEDADDGSLHHLGWLALTASTVATDAGNFALAEELWQRAAMLIKGVKDNISNAELMWERAWLRFRQNRLDQAYQDICQAFNLIEPGSDNEHFHALTMRAVIDMERDDLGRVDLYLREASEYFRRIKHDVGLASVLLHTVTFHLGGLRQSEAHQALMEALSLMREHEFYGAFYWHPATMITLCKIAIQEDWGDQMGITHPLVEGLENVYLQIHPKDVLGDFAASLAAHRLTDYWEEFEPLLRDSRAQVRRRAAQILRAAGQTTSQSQKSEIVVHSFARFELLINDQPLKLFNAGSYKARVLFMVLLLVGGQGIGRDDLAVLLWPNQSNKNPYASLHTTVAALNRVLKEAVGSKPIKIENRRYYLHFQSDHIWWDWDQLGQIIERVQFTTRDKAQLRQEVKTLYRGEFMADFGSLLPEPQELDEDTNIRWTSVYEFVNDSVEEHRAKADMWIQQVSNEDEK